MRMSVIKYFNWVVAPNNIIHHHEHCERVCQGVLLSSRLNYLKKVVSLQIYNWQRAGSELGAPGGAKRLKSATTSIRHYTLPAKIVSAYLNQFPVKFIRFMVLINQYS